MTTVIHRRLARLQIFACRVALLVSTTTTAMITRTVLLVILASILLGASALKHGVSVALQASQTLIQTGLQNVSAAWQAHMQKRVEAVSVEPVELGSTRVQRRLHVTNVQLGRLMMTLQQARCVWHVWLASMQRQAASEHATAVLLDALLQVQVGSA